MAGYQYPYQNQIQNQFNSFQQIQQMFPQPQGSVYTINSPLEIGNVPIGSTGLSLALCLNEGLMYIKSFQNGNPVIVAYRVAPYSHDTEKNTQSAAAAPSQTETPILSEEQQSKLNKIDELIERITKLETLFN